MEPLYDAMKLIAMMRKWWEEETAADDDGGHDDGGHDDGGHDDGGHDDSGHDDDDDDDDDERNHDDGEWWRLVTTLFFFWTRNRWTHRVGLSLKLLGCKKSKEICATCKTPMTFHYTPWLGSFCWLINLIIIPMTLGSFSYLWNL